MCSTDVKVYSKREPTDCSHPVEIMLFVKKEEKKKMWFTECLFE